MASVDQTAVTLFVPLVFAIVGQFSGLARALSPDEDGETVTGQPPLLFPWSNRALPSLGRLNLVHGTNVFLLANTFLLVSALDSSLLRGVLALIVLVVWLQLPLLEVDDYGTILGVGCYPLSIYFHGISTMVVAWYVVARAPADVVTLEGDLLEGELLATLGSPELRPLLAFLGLLAASAAGYLHLLGWDIDRAEAKPDDDANA